MLYSDCGINDFRFLLVFQYNEVAASSDFYLLFYCARIIHTCDIVMTAFNISEYFSDPSAAGFPHPLTIILFSWTRSAHTYDTVIATLKIFKYFLDFNTTSLPLPVTFLLLSARSANTFGTVMTALKVFVHL